METQLRETDMEKQRDRERGRETEIQSKRQIWIDRESKNA